MKILSKEKRTEQSSKGKKDNKSLTKNNKFNAPKENKIKAFFKIILEILKNKWLIKGSTTLLLVLIILAIYVGATRLLEKVTIPDIP